MDHTYTSNISPEVLHQQSTNENIQCNFSANSRQVLHELCTQPLEEEKKYGDFLMASSSQVQLPQQTCASPIDFSQTNHQARMLLLLNTSPQMRQFWRHYPPTLPIRTSVQQFQLPNDSAECIFNQLDAVTDIAFEKARAKFSDIDKQS